MKNSNRVLSVLIGIIVSISTVAFAGPGKTAAEAGLAYSIYPIKNSNKIRIAFETTTESPVKIQIYNNEGSLIHSETTKVEESKKNYDLSEYGDGTYRVKISKDGFVENHSITVSSAEEFTGFDAFFSPELDGDDRLRVAAANAMAPITLKVKDAKGTVYVEKKYDATNMNEVVNFKELGKGKYTVELSSNYKIRTQTYSVD